MRIYLFIYLFLLSNANHFLKTTRAPLCKYISCHHGQNEVTKAEVSEITFRDPQPATMDIAAPILHYGFQD